MFHLVNLKLARRFPWLIGIAASLFYGLTLSHGVTMNSLALTAKIAGWDLAPWLGQSLVWVLTLPLRLLPSAWVSVTLNLYSAAAGALTLGLLARSVRLLPWDRAWEKENRLAAMLPVVLACGLCGLEFSFWREATSTTGEMLDVLLLAMVLWLALEFRADGRVGWLDAAAFVWGLAIAQNGLMLPALPVFIGVVIWFQIKRRFGHQRIEWLRLFVNGASWLQGFDFCRLKWVLRLPLLGLAGFAIYALPPLAGGLSSHPTGGGGQAWGAGWTQTKGMIELFYQQFWSIHRILTIELAICFGAPAMVFLLRLRDRRSRRKRWGGRFKPLVFQVLRAGLLLACLWFALDPEIGPRQILRHQFGISTPLLAFDYLNALGAAFLAGNLHLFLQGRVRPSSRPRTWTHWRRLTVIPIAGGVLLVMAGLAARSLPAVLRLNSHPLEHFGELAADSLPAGGGVVLGDHAQKLQVFQAAMSHRRNEADWLVVDTLKLPGVEYRAALEHRQPAGWLTAANHHELNPVETLGLLEEIARDNRLFYLHPSFGVFFERFYLEPTGAVYELKLREAHFVENPSPTVAAVEANEVFWNRAWRTELSGLADTANPPAAGGANTHPWPGLVPIPPFQDRMTAEWSSLSLNSWAVALQQRGRWNEARVRFGQALQLNTNNVPARINLACNTILRSGAHPGLANADETAGQRETPDRLGFILARDGPFDEPTYCFLTGRVLESSGCLSQAASQFERSRTLAPGVPAPELALADLYTRLQLPDRSLQLLDHLRDQTKTLSLPGSVDVEIATLEANSWRSRTNFDQARETLEAVLTRHPDDREIAVRVARAYLVLGDLTNAMRLVSAKLARSPDDVTGLNLQAAILIQSSNAVAALPVLDHVLALTNQPAARLNRAFARISGGDFAAAAADYHELENSGVERGPVGYGLAVIAGHRHDSKQAAHYLRVCLGNTAPGSLLWRKASSRLQALDPSRGGGTY